MSVNAVTTVSIVPASASVLSCSIDSMPVAMPGPPGRVTLAMAYSDPPAIACDPGGSRGDLELGLVDRAHRPVVAVLRVDPPPDPDDQPDDQTSGE